jgi:hypothetical protein
MTIKLNMMMTRSLIIITMRSHEDGNEIDTTKMAIKLLVMTSKVILMMTKFLIPFN